MDPLAIALALAGGLVFAIPVYLVTDEVRSALYRRRMRSNPRYRRKVLRRREAFLWQQLQETRTQLADLERQERTR